MKRQTVVVLFLLLQLLSKSAAVLHAQEIVDISVDVVPPYSSRFSYYQEANIILVTLNWIPSPNNPLDMLPVRLAARVEQLDGDIRVWTSSNLPMIELPRGIPYIVRTSDVSQMIDANNISTEGIDYQSLITGDRLPEGDYRLCVYALDPVTGDTISTADRVRCANILIRYSTPPQLVWPCGSSGDVVVYHGDEIEFRWAPVFDGTLDVLYELTIEDVIDGDTRDPEVILRESPDRWHFNRAGILTPRASVPYFEYRLAESDRFVWQVRAYTSDETVAFENDGRSEVCQFRLNTIGRDDEGVDLVYPNCLFASDDEQCIADRVPPFVIRVDQNSPPRDILLTIQDLGRVDGSAPTRGSQSYYAFDVDLPLSEEVILLNAPADHALSALCEGDNYEFEPGHRYMWRVELEQPSDEGEEPRRDLQAEATVVCLPELECIYPPNSAEIDRFETRSAEFALRIEPRPTSITGSIPTHPADCQVRIIRIDTPSPTVVLDQPVVAEFPPGVNQVLIDQAFPNLSPGVYKIEARWLAYPALVALSEFTITGGAEECLTVEGIFPEHHASVPGLAVAEEPSFSIRVSPNFDESSLISGEFKLWYKEPEDEDWTEIYAGLPSATYYFDELNVRERSSSGIVYADFVPRTTDGQPIDFRLGDECVWQVELVVDPERARMDGVICEFDGYKSINYHFTVGERPGVASDDSLVGGDERRTDDGVPGEREDQPIVVECNPSSANQVAIVRHDAVADTLRIGGARLHWDRRECRFNERHELSGIGHAFYRGKGYVVEFENLVLNSDNEVIRGQANVQSQSVPGLVDGIGQEAELNAEQIRRVKQIWQLGGNLYETATDNIRVPFGVDLDFGNPDNSEPGGWAFKATTVRLVFEPTLVRYDEVIAVRVPMTTAEGPDFNWFGVYAQGIPMCETEDAEWLAAYRLYEDIQVTLPEAGNTTFRIRGSAPENLTNDYVLEPGDGTAILASHRGFEQFHIEGDLTLPRSVVVPLDGNNAESWAPAASGQVTVRGMYDVMLSGRADVSDPSQTLAGGMYLAFDLPPCIIANTSAKLQAERAVLDLSNYWTPASTGTSDLTFDLVGRVVIPSEPRPVAAYDPDWRGFHVGQGAVMIPGFGDIAFGVTNAYWGSPVSMSIFAAPHLETRLFDTLHVRLDTIDFEIDHGNFERARVMTSLSLPGTNSGRAHLDLTYHQVPDDSAWDGGAAFSARLHASPGTRFGLTDYAEFTLADGSAAAITAVAHPPAGQSPFTVQFDLSGTLGLVRRSDDNPVFKLAGIEFEHFRYASDGRGIEAPRITYLGRNVGRGNSGESEGGGGESEEESAEPSSTVDNQQAGGFPISLDDIDFEFRNGGRSLWIGADVDVALTGTESGPQFGGTLGIGLEGDLIVRDGIPQWQADRLSLDSLRIAYESDPFTVQGSVGFVENDPALGTGFAGQVNADIVEMFTGEASAQFGKRDGFRYWRVAASADLTEPIPVGPLGIYGFIGGAYSHMSASAEQNSQGIITGIRFTPTPDNVFGVTAGVHIGVLGNPESFHAKPQLRAEFEGAGVREIVLDGTGWMMCDLEDECNGPDDSKVSLSLRMDFLEDRFHGMIAGNVNLEPLLVIEAPPGSVDVLFEPGNWHVHVGRGPFGVPLESPLAATFLPGILDLNMSSYVMAGNHMDMVVGGIPVRVGGFAAGVRTELDFDQTFLIIYGSIHSEFQAEAAIIKTSGEIRDCLRGANGWYAMADLRAALEAELGIDVDTWFYSGRVALIDAALAFDLSMGGPNPTYLDGDGRGRARLLGGLIRTSFHYHFHLGDDLPEHCLAELRDAFLMPAPIVSVSPTPNSSDISCFTTIGLGFSVPMGEEISIDRETGEDPLIARVRLQEPLDVRASTGASVPGQIRFYDGDYRAEWESDGTVLESQERYTVRAVAIGEKFEDGEWREIRRQDTSWSFTAGERPRYIDSPQLVYARYPEDRQYYSYTEGHEGRHYVFSHWNLDYMLRDLSAGQSLVAQYVDDTRQVTEHDLDYEQFQGVCGSKLLVNNISLSPNRRYHLRMIKRTDLRERGLTGIPVEDVAGQLGSRLGQPRVQPRLSGVRNVTSTVGETVFQRREGNALSRVVRNGGVVDTVVFDWYFRTGQFVDFEEKARSGSLRHPRRVWDFVVSDLVMPEPIDDHITSLVFRRQPGSSVAQGRDWLSGIDRQYRWPRQIEALRTALGPDDAERVWPFVTTVRDPLATFPNMTYADMTTQFEFEGSGHSPRRLQPHELQFEAIATPPWRPVGAPPWGQPRLRNDGVLPAPPRNESATLSYLNAVSDLSQTRWGFQQALSTVGAQLSPNSRTKIEEFVSGAVSPIPAGIYSTALVQKSVNWRCQDIAMRQMGNNLRQAAILRNLERVSATGMNTADFGEFTCGSPIGIRVFALPLEVHE